MLNLTDINVNDYERVVRIEDDTTGLDGIIALHNTNLGPGLGGTRYWNYGSEADMLTDVLRLSRGMTYKNAICGNDFGGGKGVLNATNVTDKNEMLKSYAEAINQLNGTYISAGDVGISTEDLVLISQHTDHVGGYTIDSSAPTAEGVYHSIRAALSVMHDGADQATLRGVSIGIVGLGKVGSKLLMLALADRAIVTATDASRDTVRGMHVELRKHPGCRFNSARDDNLIKQRQLVYSPCALGNMINDDTKEHFRTAVICGAANNQLQDDDTSQWLVDNKILYVPDYLANSGGVIGIADEIANDISNTPARIGEIYQKAYDIVAESWESKVGAQLVANSVAEARFTSN